MSNDAEIREFFKRRRVSYSIFRYLKNVIEKIGSPSIQVSKTQISFGEEYKYLWVWLPQKWIRKRPEMGLTLTIVTGTKLKSKKIVESVQPKKGFWTHHILIDDESDIDSEIYDLIKASYDFYLERRRRKELRKGKRTLPAFRRTK